MKTYRSLACACLLFCVLGGAGAQIRREAPAPGPEGGDFGSKFFDDLRRLFGRLQRAELDRALQGAKAIHCSDLVEGKGEWKEVAFLNDDRKLGDWHFDSIDEVKRDLVTFVFSGNCSTEQGPVKVSTSYPVQETFDKFQKGQIPFSGVVIKANDPVSAVFDRTAEAYIFQLPYLYLGKRTGTGNLYTLTPPLTTSKPDPDVAEEFRCKALSDAELTYRFLLCRIRVVSRNAGVQRQNERQELGNAAYYIFSDGKEASSSVKLSFGDTTASRTPAPELVPGPDVQLAAERQWQPAAPQVRLVIIGQSEFGLRFNAETWAGRIGKPQSLAAQMLSDFVATSPPARSREYCVWRPGMPGAASRLLEERASNDVLYTVAFRKDLQSVSSAVFEMQNDAGSVLGKLECFFPQNQTPADVTVGRWISIVGAHIELEAPE